MNKDANADGAAGTPPIEEGEGTPPIEETVAAPPKNGKVGEIFVDGKVVDQIEHDGKGSFVIENGDWVREGKSK